MDVAASVEVVSERIEALLGRSADLGNAVRSLLSGPFRDFERTAIVGGMVRDVARGVPFNSDIDIVIEASASHVGMVASSIGARSNSFGGWTADWMGFEVDFWALETTWAVRTGLVQASSINDIPKTTFFNHDAAVFDLQKRRVICEDQFLAGLREREIEVNLSPSPTIEGNLYRAARRILLWHLVPGRRLRDFIIDHLDDPAFCSMRYRENRKRETPLFASFASAVELRDRLFTNV